MYRMNCNSCGKLLFKFRGDIDRVVVKCPKCRQINTLTTVEARPPKIIETIVYTAKNQ